MSDGAMRIWNLAGLHAPSDSLASSSASDAKRSESAGKESKEGKEGKEADSASLISTTTNTADVLSVEWDSKVESLLMFGLSNAKIKVRWSALCCDQCSGTHVDCAWLSWWSVVERGFVQAARGPGRVKSERPFVQLLFALAPVCRLDADACVLLLASAAQEYPCVLELASSPTDPVFVSSCASKTHDSLEGGKGELTLWSLHTGKKVNTFHIESSYSQVNSMVINHNGTTRRVPPWLIR
jgi:hypothetical protein